MDASKVKNAATAQAADSYSAKVAKIKDSLRLMNSMILCGEKHSTRSAEALVDALDALADIEHELSSSATHHEGEKHGT